MATDPGDLDRLLDSVADGDRLDWEALEARGADPRARNRISALRRISDIVSFHQERQREDVAGASPPMERWGDLLLLERLGAGAHAEVFRAWDPSLQREVALKLVRATPSIGGESPLLAEGRAVARVRHPNVVTVHGVASHAGQVGLWMELIAGPTLEQMVRSRGPLGVAEVVRLGREIGAALAAVHDAAMLHCDIKPANIMTDAQGRFVLSDFGIGRRGSAGQAEPRWRGTPMYMAPECLAGAAPTERSDSYSLGMVLWFALAGRHPHAAETIEELRATAASGPPALGSVRADLPRALEDVVTRAISPRPEDRFPTARALVEALERFDPAAASSARPATAQAPRHSQRAWTMAAALTVLAALAAVVLPRLRETPQRPLLPAPVEPAAAGAYDVEASFERRAEGTIERLVAGDRVRPGDRLSLRIRATRPAWVYVLNEDDRGERYLLFPQPLFDQANPLPPDSMLTLPGTIGGKENGWTVTSRGGHERFLVVASLAPVAELETELSRLPPVRQDRTVRYAPVTEQTVERLRGTGGVAPVTPGDAETPPSGFDRFRALADREVGVRGIWVRQIVLENP